MGQFTTHNGDIIKGKQLAKALHIVAEKMILNAHAVFKEDAYASHITASQKLVYLGQRLELAESMREGKELGFWAWQLINIELTGECVGFLPPKQLDQGKI